MVINEINGVKFKLKEYQDFTWLNRFGKVFKVIDETGSGCICFGVCNGDDKYFFKIAGAKTIKAEITEEESIVLLKEAIQIYKTIKHPNLIKLIDSFDQNEFFVAQFLWADGECLFDHWNFEKYKKHPNLETPISKFKRLTIDKKLEVIDKLFTFFEASIKAGYVAVDFYDSSILYDFDNYLVSFCDIDLFKKMPVINEAGEKYYGTKRLKAPEENELGEVIDEQTNIFTLGAIIFDLLSNVKNNEERYTLGHFIPNDLDDFGLGKKQYKILRKATALNRHERYKTIKEFHFVWNNSIRNEESL